MAIDYPDIISEYLDAPERYETGGVQIVPYLEPAQIAVGGVTKLALFLQSAVDVPVELTLKPDLPQTGRFRGSPMLALGEPELNVALEAAQVGILFSQAALFKSWKILKITSLQGNWGKILRNRFMQTQRHAAIPNVL